MSFSLTRVISPAFVYLLVSLVLFGVAVVVHFHSSTLSLPLSPVVSILAVLLPIFAFLSAYTHPTVLHTAHARSASRVAQLAPFIIQTLQALITAVLATLLLQGVVPTPALTCVLENEWMGRFRDRDAHAIRSIQDTLNCCGFNSVRDRAFPFPRDGASSTCAQTYDREQACRGSWQSAMQSTAGVDFAVVVVIGLMQVLGLLIMRDGTNIWTAWRSRRQGNVLRRRESSRPLLTGPEPDEETIERDVTETAGYGTADRGDSGPRVEPSAFSDRNAWNE